MKRPRFLAQREHKDFHSTPPGGNELPIPITRTVAEIVEVESAANLAARTGAPDPYAEGFLNALAWERGQLPTSTVMLNFADEIHDGHTCTRGEGGYCAHG